MDIIRNTRRILTGLVAAAAAALVPGTADAGWVFDHNFTDLEWRSIETEHFFVHYPVSKKGAEEGNDHFLDSTASARRTAKVSEEYWEPVCANFDYYLNEKVHIVLVNQTDYLEGFTVPPFDWIVISANPGAYFYRMRGRMEWFGDVLVHEFGHVVSLKQSTAMSEGAYGVVLQTLYRDGIRDHDTGASVFLTAAEPFWWSEGVTEYSSDEAGYNWWSNSRDQNIRMTFLEDRVLSYDEMVVIMDKDDFGDGERNYQQGYSLNAYIRQRFGDEVPFKFAEASGQRWRPNWQTVSEEVTGVRLRQIYDDWHAYNTARYEAMWDEVRAEGEAVGREILSGPGGWEYTDPDGRDKWMAKDIHDREAQREGGGRWDFYPKMSSDGRWYAENSSGMLAVSLKPEWQIPTLADGSSGAMGSGTRQRSQDMSMRVPSEFGHSWDFIDGEDALIMTGNEHHIGSPWIPGGRVELDGYEWKALYIASLEPRMEKRKHRGEKVEYETLEPKKKLGKRADHWRYEMVPDTLRGHDPAMSPDGKTIAFIQYEDGSDYLALIDRDGSNKRIIAGYTNAFVQNVDWSPDGTQLVFSLFKDQRQDLFIINADGTGMKAINRDPWEDQDAHWAADGNIYFSSDPTGIFNIYRYEPDTGAVVQVTNTIAGAQMPWITPEGDLLYVNLMAHGWKSYAMAVDEFLEADVSYQFSLDVDQDEVEQFLAFEEDLSEYSEYTKYRPAKRFIAPMFIPVLSLENDTMTNWGFSPGFQLQTMDFVGDHSAFAIAQAGEDPMALAWWSYTGWYPQINMMAYYAQYKSDFGRLLDDDDDLTTTKDQEIFEAKQAQNVYQGMVSMIYPVNGRLEVGIGAFGYQYGFRTTANTQWDPYMFGLTGQLFLTFNTVRARYGQMNPYYGRHVEASFDHSYSDVVYSGSNGYNTDDGELLDKYHANRFQLQWTEHMPLRGFGLEALDFMKRRRHVLELSFRGGIVDRNVQVNDEFRGGGTHPIWRGSSAIQPNNQFSGYPAYSLAGETMLVASAAYRFPLKQDIDKRLGAFYLYDIHMQLGGTAGNLWSYRLDDSDPANFYYDPWGEKIAYDPKDVKREIPFVDSAYKNGNWMLFDAMAEVRVSAALLTSSWNSFFRVAYGFNEITGIWDPNGDDVSETTRNGEGNALSAETERPGPRFYIGIGTGW